MAGKSASMRVKIIADARQASGEISRFESRLEKMHSAVNKMILPATAAGGALIAFGRMAGDAAADAEQNFGAVNTVFKDAADSVHKWAEDSAQAVGMSSSSYEELAASIGGSLQKAGYSADEMASKTNGLINAGADLSSVFGGDAAEAAGAMGAALRGEFDPLERFGVFMSMTAVNARMAAEGTSELEGAAFEQAKKQAIVNEIMEQAAAYQGNFAREADTAAGAQQRANAQFENAKAKLGEALLPYMVKGADAAADMARWVSENSSTVEKWAIGLGAAATSVFALKGVLIALTTGVRLYQFFSSANRVVRAYKAGLSLATAAQAGHATAAGLAGSKLAGFGIKVGAATKALKAKTAALIKSGAAATAAKTRWLAAKAAAGAMRAATLLWAGAQKVLNFALRNNPIGRVITVVAALAAAFVWAYKNVGWFRDGVDAAVVWIVDAWNWAVKGVINGISAARDWFASLGDWATSVFRNIIDWVNGVRRRVSGLFDGFRPPSWLRGVLGSTQEPVFYDVGHPTLPFTATAAESPLEAVFSRPVKEEKKIIHNYNMENNFNGIVGDPLAVARQLDALMKTLKNMTGGYVG